MTFKNAEKFAEYIINKNIDTRKLPKKIDYKALQILFPYRTFGAGLSSECYKTDDFKKLTEDTYNKLTNLLKENFSFPIEWSWKLVDASGGSTWYSVEFEENAPYQMELSDFINMN